MTVKRAQASAEQVNRTLAGTATEIGVALKNIAEQTGTTLREAANSNAEILTTAAVSLDGGLRKVTNAIQASTDAYTAVSQQNVSAIDLAMTQMSMTLQAHAQTLAVTLGTHKDPITS